MLENNDKKLKKEFGRYGLKDVDITFIKNLMHGVRFSHSLVPTASLKRIRDIVP